MIDAIDNPMILIGLVGPAGSGKTTAAKILVERYGFLRLPFAGPLKAMAAAFGLTDQEINGDLEETPCAVLNGKTPRQFQQWLGTEFGRNLIGPDVWVDAWYRAREKAFVDGARRFVVDDVRFANEATTIRTLGGRIIKIERAGSGSQSAALHESERLAFPIDEVMFNHGSLEDLQCGLQHLLHRVHHETCHFGIAV